MSTRRPLTRALWVTCGLDLPLDPVPPLDQGCEDAVDESGTKSPRRCRPSPRCTRRRRGRRLGQCAGWDRSFHLVPFQLTATGVLVPAGVGRESPPRRRPSASRTTHRRARRPTVDRERTGPSTSIPFHRSTSGAPVLAGGPPTAVQAIAVHDTRLRLAPASGAWTGSPTSCRSNSRPTAAACQWSSRRTLRQCTPFRAARHAAQFGRGRAGNGLDLPLGAVPPLDQRLVVGASLEDPTAVQAVSEVHDTLSRLAPASPCVDWIVHIMPFQCSTSGRFTSVSRPEAHGGASRFRGARHVAEFCSRRHVGRGIGSSTSSHSNSRLAGCGWSRRWSPRRCSSSRCTTHRRGRSPMGGWEDAEGRRPLAETERHAARCQR